MSTIKPPLGQAIMGVAKEAVPPNALEQRIAVLEQRIAEMEARFRRANREPERTKSKTPQVPYNVLLVGITRGIQYTLVRTPQGFRVGNSVYKSLSAAAEAVSGVRRSGWTFWRLPDGRTAKEAFGKK